MARRKDLYPRFVLVNWGVMCVFVLAHILFFVLLRLLGFVVLVVLGGQALGLAGWYLHTHGHGLDFLDG